MLKGTAALIAYARSHPLKVGSALAVLAAMLAAACTGGRRLPALRPEPVLRVALAVGAPSVRIRSDGEVQAVTAGQPAFHLRAGDSVVLQPQGQGLESRGRVGGHFETLAFASLTEGRPVVVNGRAYRGTVEVFARGGAVTAVNVVPLEAYLLGVVNAEMGRRTSSERAALEAQAVVSRTYALRNQGRFASAGYDVAATVTDQAYGGVAAETPEGTAAVQATAGVALTWHGEPILAFFHSTCGYATATPGEAFRGIADAPYLRSVSDRRPGGGYYCDISPHFRWSVAWDGDQLRDILRRTIPAALGIDAGQVGDIRDVRVEHTGPSGRATEVRIDVGKGTIPVFAPDLRTVFQAPTGDALGSTAFQLHAERTGDRLVRLTAAGAGWGHGVGMCQWGAVGRARAGQDYQAILGAYFPGATLQRLY